MKNSSQQSQLMARNQVASFLLINHRKKERKKERKKTSRIAHIWSDFFFFFFLLLLHSSFSKLFYWLYRLTPAPRLHSCLLFLVRGRRRRRIASLSCSFFFFFRSFVPLRTSHFTPRRHTRNSTRKFSRISQSIVSCRDSRRPPANSLPRPLAGPSVFVMLWQSLHSRPACLLLACRHFLASSRLFARWLTVRCLDFAELALEIFGQHFCSKKKFENYFLLFFHQFSSVLRHFFAWKILQ